MDKKPDEQATDDTSSIDGDSGSEKPILDIEEVSDPAADDPKVAQAEAEALLMGAREQRKSETKNTQKKVLLLLAVAVVIMGGVFFLTASTSDDEETNPDSATPESTQVDNNEEGAEPDAFSNIIYAHSPSDSATRELYQRPVVGGDREQLGFSFGSEFLNVKREGQSYIVYSFSGGSVYYGVGANAPEEIFTTNDDVVSVDYDPNSQTVAISTLANTTSGSPTFDVQIVDVNTKASESFFSSPPVSSSAGQFVIYHWDKATDSFIGQRVRPNSEDATTKLERFNADGSTQELFDNGLNFAQSQYVFSRDGQRALYFVAKNDFTEGEIATYDLVGGLAEPAGAPFELYELDVEEGNARLIVTIGEIGDNDELERWPVITWADFSDGQRASYAYMNKLYVQDGSGGYSNYFATDRNPITSIYAVDDDEVVVGANIDGGERISYYNIETRNGAIVMETLPSTTILTISME